MNHSLLFQPATLGTLAVKNRLVCAVEEASVEGCLASLAAGESCGAAIANMGHFGLWFLDAGSVHASSEVGPALYSETVQPVRKWLTQQAHGLDVKVIQRLTHGGMRFPSRNGESSWGPSSRLGANGLYSRFMTVDDIREIVLAFVSAALMCQINGLDGVEICATDMHLLHQFISEQHNERDDRYGGSCKNRCRFLLETVRAVRAAVGSDFAVGVSAGVNGGIFFDADGNASNLLLQLKSEGLLGFIGISSPTKAFPAGTLDVPRVLSTTCATFADAEDLVSESRADLIAVSLAPEHAC